jgi:hypothetical protein
MQMQIEIEIERYHSYERWLSGEHLATRPKFDPTKPISPLVLLVWPASFFKCMSGRILRID